MKNLNDTYLYREFPDYDKNIYEMILKGERVDKHGESFENIKYEIKRKNVDSSLAKLLDSERIVLVLPNKPLPKAFKFVLTKDIRNDKKTKVFIDCSGVLVPNGSDYKFINNQAVNILISYLVAARTAFIMEAKPTSLLLNSALTQAGTKTFASMVNYVVDYIGKININIPTRNKSLYLSAVYYQVNLLGKDIDSDSVKELALKISGISERESNIIELDYEKDSFDNIYNFIKLMKESLKVKGLSFEVFIEKWMFLFGTGTVFGLELFPYFAQTITDAYIGAYINNQKTVEKVAGQNMVDFSKSIIKIGADSSDR